MSYYTVHHKGLLLCHVICYVVYQTIKTKKSTGGKSEGLYLCAQDISKWYSYKVAILDFMNTLTELLMLPCNWIRVNIGLLIHKIGNYILKAIRVKPLRLNKTYNLLPSFVQV